VCRESGDVALENAGVVKANNDPNAPSWSSGTSLKHRWFSPATDIVHLNWGPGYSAEFDYSGESPIPFFLWEADKGIAASLTADLLYPFDDPFREVLGWLTDDYDMLEQRKDYLVWRDRGCAVGVHDRQDSGIGRHIAVGSRNGRPVGRSQYIAQTHKIEWPAL
jgi:hypothetical protein